MRMGPMFFGTARRNDPVKLVDPHPVEDHGRASIESGNAGLDGFTCLARANPDMAGNRPSVKGTIGPVYRGPDNSFEQ